MPYSAFDQCMDTLGEIDNQIRSLHSETQSILADLRAKGDV